VESERAGEVCKNLLTLVFGGKIMKIISLCCLTIVLSSCFISCNDPEYNCRDSENGEVMKQILSDLDDIAYYLYSPHHSYHYISIDIESPQHNGKAVVGIESLLCYLQRKEKYSSCDFSYDYKFKFFDYYHEYRQDINKNKYVNKIRCMLKKQSTLKVEIDDDFAKRFLIVHNDSAVAANAQKGVDYFIKAYFRESNYPNGRSLNDSITIDKEIFAAIVNQLYDFKIPISPSLEQEDTYLIFLKKESKWGH